ncbi:hypothetical protein ACFW35_04705 [Fictibacillus sp. NPDC058756]|uniref:hypothetical protein n=1 Tax=Fictibacillus sp. NPDC058756 TaxID=3346625 RepID=UPI00369B04B6
MGILSDRVNERRRRIITYILSVAKLEYQQSDKDYYHKLPLAKLEQEYKEFQELQKKL